MSVANTDFLHAARVLKSNGTDGEVIIGFREFVPEEINLTEPLYIYFDGLAVPFFIEQSNIKGNRLYAKLTSVKNLKDAQELEGKDVFVNKDSIADYSDDDDYLSPEDIVGWTVLDENMDSAGVVMGWEDIPGNPCLYIKTTHGESMIPFNESLILDVMEEAKKISLRIPEGLI